MAKYQVVTTYEVEGDIPPSKALDAVLTFQATTSSLDPVRQKDVKVGYGASEMIASVTAENIHVGVLEEKMELTGFIPLPTNVGEMEQKTDTSADTREGGYV